MTCDPLTDDACTDGTPCAACPSPTCCTDARDADPWKTWVWHDHPPAPPLSPAEQAVVDRFDAAGDPWEEG